MATEICQKLSLTRAPGLGCLLWSAAGWYYRDYVDCYYRFQQQVMPRALTYGGGEEGDSFSFFAVVVDGQVPDARVHVLDEARVVGGDGHQAPLHSNGPLQTMDVLGQKPPPIQKLHKVKLRKDAQNVRKTDGWTTETPLEWHVRLECFQPLFIAEHHLVCMNNSSFQRSLGKSQHIMAG